MTRWQIILVLMLGFTAGNIEGLGHLGPAFRSWSFWLGSLIYSATVVWILLPKRGQG